MKALNRNYLRENTAADRPVEFAPLKERPERILQFGEGNFLRAFVDWMFDVMNGKELFDGNVVVVQPIPSGQVEILNRQDGLYTLVLRGMWEGKTVERLRVITSVSRGINPYRDWDAFQKAACGEHLRFVVSNTTEAGICWTPEPYPQGCPQSFPAKVAVLLHLRYQAFKGHPEKGLIFLPCELIDRNGDQLKAMVLRHAQAWGLGSEFQDWVAKHNHFLNTLVDRIVPGYPREDCRRLQELLGYDDPLLDAGELFHLWVIEGPEELARELPFAEAGLNVVWTSDLSPYRTRKVRILNGAHTATVLAAFLGGVNTVGEMLAHPVFGRCVRRTIFDEIVPVLPFPEEEKMAYAKAVIERFENPFIRHELLSISLNSVSKWRVRVLPSILDYVSTRGSVPPLLGFSMSALICFYRGVRENGNACELKGRWSEGVKREYVKREYIIRDEERGLAVFEKEWKYFDGHQDCGRLVSSLLANTDLWGMDLTSIPGFTQAVRDGVIRILHSGMMETARALVEK